MSSIFYKFEKLFTLPLKNHPLNLHPLYLHVLYIYALLAAKTAKKRPLYLRWLDKMVFYLRHRCIMRDKMCVYTVSWKKCFMKMKNVFHETFISNLKIRRKYLKKVSSCRLLDYTISWQNKTNLRTSFCEPGKKSSKFTCPLYIYVFLAAKWGVNREDFHCSASSRVCTHTAWGVHPFGAGV